MKQSQSRIFIIIFATLMILAPVLFIYNNIQKRPETEAATVVALAGQKLLSQKYDKDQIAKVHKFEDLQIVTSTGNVNLQVEVMQTPEELAKGLMFRQSMPEDKGMLFDFGIDRPVPMWMKNTYIPLDMIFINANGKIHRIEENTEPFSEKTISSGIPIRSVLELNAGTTRRLGIKAGDRLVHTIFSK